jgi:hypothetical protein
MPYTNAAEKITPMWEAKDIPLLKGKVAIATAVGIEDIGRHVAYQLAYNGAQV